MFVVGNLLEAIIPSTNCSRISMPSPRLSCRRKKSVMRNFLSRSHAMYRCLHSSKSKLLKLSNCKTSSTTQQLDKQLNHQTRHEQQSDCCH